MSIFGDLHEDAFLVFSRGNRHLYAKVILEVYREFYGTLHLRIAPRRTEVVDFIAGILRGHLGLWTENEEVRHLPDTAGRRARQRRRRRADTSEPDSVALKSDLVYGRLVSCGWLEEDQIHFTVIAEMPPAAQAMAERFHEIDRGLSQFLGGLVIEIRNALQSLEANAEQNALGLKQGVDSAIDFIRRLRAIHASLRAIEREIVGSSDLKTRLRTFFDDFLGKLLIQDFKAILTTNHPYRFRHEIVSTADRLAMDPSVVDQAGAGYVASKVAETKEAADSLVVLHLHQISEAFESIEGDFRRINDFRMRLENRLRNTIRYMERADEKSTAKLVETIQKLAITEAARGSAGLRPFRYPTMLSLEAARLHPGEGEERRGSLAFPPVKRRQIKDEVLEERSPNPALSELRRLERQWLATSDPDFNTILEWLDRKLRPGESIESKLIHLADVPDLFLFLKAREVIRSAELGDEYHIKLLTDRREDKWISTPNFRITRQASKASNTGKVGAAS